MKEYRVIRAWETYCVGDVITPTGVPRDRLLQRKFIELVEDEESELEIATVEQPLEHAALRVDAPAPRKAGRPKGSKNKPKIGV